MSNEKRCGTCVHYVERFETWGICDWRPSTPIPWWVFPTHAIYPSEGTNCPTWEAKR